ncbi:hypothetical protein SCACP_35210 [Sporomusa carbonis]|uniref:hypothetical protein n=1 Tax=Sporomusa carbonis TaxID=3076075 RepID=UPI003A6F0EB3
MTQVFLDNQQFGLVGEVLKERLKPDSTLLVAAPYMTLYAFREMQDVLKKVKLGSLVCPDARKDHRKNRRSISQNR